MKKLTLSAAFFCLLQFAFAGGLLTNYNQSAQYVRMLSRNASYDIDAVFYNPAGLSKLNDGWHFAFSSQTIFQEREVFSGFPLLNNDYYKGTTTIPVFPDLYGVYKKDKWAFSVGVGPVAGGGTAKFDGGLPSFEIPISKAVPALAGLKQLSPAMDVTGYGLDMAFEASSVFWGIQLGATYKVNDVVSVYGGVRVMPSVNTYKGSITDVTFNVAGNVVPASDFLSGASTQIQGMADGMYGAASSLQPAVDGGYSTATLAQLELGGAITAQQRAQLEGGLQQLGVPQAQIDAMNIAQIQGTYNAAGAQFEGQAVALGAQAASLDDRYVDTKQKGTGFTPVIGINIAPNDDWNFAFKYEHKTKLTLTNETKVDDMGLFPDKAESSSDVPGFFTAGMGFRGIDNLEVQLSYSLFMDKDVDYGYNVRYKTAGELVHREIDKNYFELALGLQYDVSDKLALSLGGLRSKNGVAENYQSDFSFTNSSYTLATGFRWKITDKVVVDAGILNTFYQDDDVVFVDPDVGNYSENYNKSTLDFSFGISYSIF